jgi:hypothetical protein
MAAYGTKTVQVYIRKGRPFMLHCKENEPLASSTCTDLERLVISVVQAKRFARKGCKSFLTTVTKILDGDASTVELPDSVASVLHEFEDVFPEDVPALAPERPGVSHTIPLDDPHAKPPSRPLYRLSIKELEEAERQVHLLLEKQFIAPILFV